MRNKVDISEVTDSSGDRETVLSIRGLDIGFETAEGMRSTVRNMSLDLVAGEIFGLVGESGSGKTLVSLSILGLLPSGAAITGGSISFNGRDLLQLTQDQMRELRGNRISMVFQDPHASLDPLFTCGDQIADALLMHENIGRKRARAKARDLLERLRLPDPDRVMRSYPHELSGGQCQRVMIAMAVACKPDVIIADEPTTALDVTVQKQVLDLLRELNREVKAAILLITHDLGVVAQIADRVGVMCRGDKVDEAPTQELFLRPGSDYTRALIEAMPSVGNRRDRFAAVNDKEKPSVAASAAPDAAAKLLSDSKVNAEQDKIAGHRREDVLRLVNLSKDYNLTTGAFGSSYVFRAVNEVNLGIPARTTLGLVGESGCGKSTLSRLILRMQEATSGEILFNGRDIRKLSRAELRTARQEMAMVFQNPYGSLNPRQQVKDLVAAPLQIVGRAADGPETARRLIDAVGLPASALDKYPHQFSGGQRQRIAIARALALNPKLLICDEAVSALDVSVQAQVLNLLKDLQQEFDLTYLFISHDLAVVEHFSDTIAVMQAGRIIEQGPVELIFGSPHEEYTRQLLAASPRIDIEMEPRNTEARP